MPLISDKYQNDVLKRNNINIKSKYIVENKILERNTDNSYNDDVTNGILCEKQYFVNNRLLKIEKDFDSRINYTFIFNDQKNSEYTCPNCGTHYKIRDFIDGCPYCRTYYNIDYTEKDLGGKYHYDRVLRSSKYRIITAVIDVIISLIISFIFIKTTSRTFNSYDITKIFIYGIILSLILYYFFYIIDGYIILEPIKRYKDSQNKKQIEFWDRTKIEKTKFFNNLNYEIKKKYYKSDDIIDFDILDYDEFTDSVIDNILNVNVKAYIRIIKYKNGNLNSEYIVDSFNMKQLNKDILNINKGVNIVKCHNCGASVDATKGICEYCHTKINPLQEWVMD